MKQYLGTKTVMAEPQEKDGKAGYKVVYEDGYVSWSPKEVFEKAYREAGTIVQRMEIELMDLVEKRDKLVSFFGTDTFKELAPRKQALLHYQEVLMRTYIEVLEARIYLENGEIKAKKASSIVL